MAKEGEAFKLAFDYVRALEMAQKDVHEKNVRNARLYGNDMLGPDWRTSRGARHASIPSENVIESVIDTVSSKIARLRPRATFQTDGAGFDEQRRAKQLEKFVEGQFQKSGIYQVGPLIFRDGCIFGTGALKLFADDGKICMERVLPDDLIVDQQEARLTAPRQVHHRFFIHIEVLKTMYPEKEKQITEAGMMGGQSPGYYTPWRKYDAQIVPVVESWHLPSKEGEDDGRHCVSIETTSLEDEPWTKSVFPFVFYRWSQPVTGFYGRGLSEQLTGHQLQINRLNRHIQENLNLFANPRVLAHVSDAGLGMRYTNGVGQVIFYRSKEPRIDAPKAVSSDVFFEIERIKRSAFEFAGISMLSATSRKPGGLDSAVALREYNDIETERFSIQAQAYEQFFLDAATQVVALGKELYSGGQKDLSVVWSSGNVAEQIRWRDVDPDEDLYTMSVEAASMLSRTPAGRKQDVMDYLAMGIIDLNKAARLLGHPDLEEEMSLRNAALDDAKATIAELENEDAEFPVPEPYQNLPMCIEQVQSNLLRVRHIGAPEEVLQRHRDWLELANRLMQKAVEGAQQAQMQGPQTAQPGVLQAETLLKA